LAQQEHAMKDAVSSYHCLAVVQQSSCRWQHTAAVTAKCHLSSAGSVSWSVDGTNISASGFSMLSASSCMGQHRDHSTYNLIMTRHTHSQFSLVNCFRISTISSL